MKFWYILLRKQHNLSKVGMEARLLLVTVIVTVYMQVGLRTYKWQNKKFQNIKFDQLHLDDKLMINHFITL